MTGVGKTAGRTTAASSAVRLKKVAAAVAMVVLAAAAAPKREVKGAAARPKPAGAKAVKPAAPKRRPGGDRDLQLVWTSPAGNGTYVLAWADYDQDGDPDLAVGNKWGTGQNQLYRNDGGQLVLAWTAPFEDATESNGLAWGDWDGDGDLDLAVGNDFGQPNYVYENIGGKLKLAWTSAETDRTLGVAWADWDGDGDLDLAVVNVEQPNRVYKNTGGKLELAWTSAEKDRSEGLAWGDWDGDGDLDLAVANFANQPNRVYRNTGGKLELAWSAPENDQSLSVAWGDWDGDGDLDLAVGNESESNRVYENTGGKLRPAWTSIEIGATRAVAWGDWDNDGDLDLAVGNEGDPNRVYENLGGRLVLAWTSAERDNTISVAWADCDGDGYLDLACGNKGPNRLYRNLAGKRARILAKATPKGIPPSREEFDMAYGGGSKLIVFGGNSRINGKTLRDTWEYDSRTHRWKEYNRTGLRPPARCWQAMAYLGGSRLVMFSGNPQREGRFLDDTWEYDLKTHTWQKIDLGEERPSPRNGHAMAYLGGSKAVMFGGWNEHGYLTDTWEYDGTTQTWRETIIKGEVPPIRGDFPMAHVDQNRAVAFGGSFPAAGLRHRNDTWEYNAAAHAWRKIPIVGLSPPVRCDPGMAFVGDSRIILFGGWQDRDDAIFNDTWEYDGALLTWKRIEKKPPAAIPHPRYIHGMATAGEGRAVVFGGNTRTNETWEFNVQTRAWTKHADRPPIFTSGPCRKGKIDLYFPPTSVAVPRTKQAPKIDGRLDDPCWQGATPVRFHQLTHLEEPAITLFIRRDDDNLYFACERKAVRRGGRSVPFAARHPNRDDPDSGEDDHFEIFFTDRQGQAALHLGVTAAGGAFDGRYVVHQDQPPDLDWDGRWTFAVKRSIGPLRRTLVTGQTDRWTVEIAVPLQTLVDENIDPAALAINCLSHNACGQGRDRAYLTDPALRFGCCRKFLPLVDPAETRSRPYTVRLHFARTGVPVFDAKLQGKTVLKDFAVARDIRRDVIRQFRGIQAAGKLTLELIPKAKEADGTVPILRRIEVIPEGTRSER